MTIEKEPHADAETIQDFVLQRVPDAKVVSSVGTEIAFQLPSSASSAFRPLFEAMDDGLKTLGIDTYGMSVTTVRSPVEGTLKHHLLSFVTLTWTTLHVCRTLQLEEVFIKVAKGEETDVVEKVLERRRSLERRNSQEEAAMASKVEKFEIGDPETGATEKGVKSPVVEVDYSDNWKFFRRHMYALLVKRGLYFSRDKKAWVYQFIMPAIFVLVGVVLMKVGNNSIFAEVLPALTLSTSGYNTAVKTNPNPLYYNNDNYFSYTNPLTYSNQMPTEFYQNYNVTGQEQVIEKVPSYSSLPAYGIKATSIYNMSMELLFSRTSWQASRYGAVTFNNVSKAGHIFEYNIHNNYSGAHSSAIFLNLINDAILQLYLPSGSITTVINPLAVTQSEYSTATSFSGFPVVVMLMLAFAFIPAAFAVFVVRERETKAKHLQIVSGVSFFSYWLSTFLFDFASYQIPLWLTVIILKAFSVDALMKGKAFGATVILLELWGASVTGFTYFVSFAFEKHSQAQVGPRRIVDARGVRTSLAVMQAPIRK